MKESKYIVFTIEKHNRLLNGPCERHTYEADTDYDILQIYRRMGVREVQAHLVGEVYKTQSDILDFENKSREENEKKEYERLKAKFENGETN